MIGRKRKTHDGHRPPDQTLPGRPGIGATSPAHQPSVWAIGERLPTEPELSPSWASAQYRREAMRVLAFSGLIEIRQGDGSYLRSMTDPLGHDGARFPIAHWSRHRKRGRFWSA